MPEKTFIVWPEYFDSTLPRRLGRRVPKELAVPHPTLRDILNACVELNLKCEAHDNKRYPRNWFSSRGYVIVTVSEDAGLSKNELVKAIANKLAEIKKR